MKAGKNDPRCGIPCDTLVCDQNRWRTAMRDFGALRCEPVRRFDSRASFPSFRKECKSRVRAALRITNCIAIQPQLLGSDFGRADFSRIFLFEPPDFFRGFCGRIFSPHFCGKSAQKNPPGKSPAKSFRKIPGNILQNICHKNARQLSA